MTQSTSTDRPAAPPIPAPGPNEAPFWEATQRGELALPSCDSCGWLAYPPSSVCTNCHVDPPAFGWTTISGRATLATWTIIRDAFLPGFTSETPYVVGEFEIPEQAGLRIIARVIGIEIPDLKIGLAMSVGFVDGGEGTRIPVFHLADSQTTNQEEVSR